MIHHLTKGNIAEFRKKIKHLFKKNLVFAFICGSIARGTATSNSDIDIFVATNQYNRSILTQFRKWYLNFHQKLNLISDKKYPGEVIPISNLRHALKLAWKSIPQKVVRRRNVHNGIVWAGMLSGNIVGLIGNQREFKTNRATGSKICQKWGYGLSVKKLRGMDISIILKNTIIYRP